MDELEMMYYDLELSDIKAWCKKHGCTMIYDGKEYFLYNRNIYDSDMSLIIERAEQGFLDLYEYFEYFPQITR